MNDRRPELSIVIPAYNEVRRLPRGLKLIRAYLEARKLDAEVIVVDDGSADGTAEIAERFRATLPALRVLRNDVNRGKGYSVRRGMLEARGRIALFTDADLSAPIEEADKLFAALESCDVAFGSRAVDRSLTSARQSQLREVAGIIFNKLVQAVLWLPIVDTQCGFKAFVLDRARIVFEQQRIERFGFDPELLFLAARHGLRWVEIPVRWAHDADTKVHVFHDSLRMLRDLAQIRWNWLCGRYPRREPSRPA
jgi:dolichyl-phosphate beta-glucosyltransferase